MPGGIAITRMPSSPGKVSLVSFPVENREVPPENRLLVRRGGIVENSNHLITKMEVDNAQ